MNADPSETTPAAAATAPSPPGDDARGAVTLLLPPGFVAPPVCIGCAAPSDALGALSEAVPIPLALCDSCRADAEKRATRLWAERAAALLLGGSVGAFCLVRFGLDALALQALAVVGAASVLPLASRLLRESEPPLPELRRTSRGVELCGVRSEVAERLGAERIPFERHREPSSPSPERTAKVLTRSPARVSENESGASSRRVLWPTGAAGPAVVALGLWLLALLFGRSELWVFHSEPGMVLLVDGRVAGRPLGALEETSAAGLRLELFAGAHTLALFASNGEERLTVNARLGAGESHLLGQPPPRLCLFEERRLGAVAELRVLALDAGLTPLSRSPDVWLAPLPTPAVGVEPGLTSAVRLLDCDAVRSSR